VADKPSIFDQPEGAKAKPSIFDQPEPQAAGKKSIFDTPAPAKDPDFEAYRKANTPIVLAPAEELAQNNAALLEAQGVFPDQAVISGGPAPAPKPPGPSLMSKLKAIPGKVKAFALEKDKEHQDAMKARWNKMGVLAPLYPELAIEAGKSVAGKVEKLYQGLRPNDAKRNAQWAEDDMKALLKEVESNPPNSEGKREPTPAQLQRFKDRAAFAKQMWAMAETERGKRNEAVQGFQKRMDAMTLPATPGAKLVAPLIPLAVQAATLPGSIPVEVAANTVGEANLRNPTYEQTTGQQVKEAIAGYGMGKFMMSGMPGVPVSRALQSLGMRPVAANLTGMVPTSVTNVYGGHQLQRALTTPHGDTPDAPTFTDFLHDYATQIGLGARHLNQPLVQPAGAPGPGEPTRPVPMGLTPLEGPMAPGGLNLPAPGTAPLPAPAQVYGPAMRPALTPGTLDTVFPRLPANLRGQLGVQDGQTPINPADVPATLPANGADGVNATGGGQVVLGASGLPGAPTPASPSGVRPGAARPPRQEFFTPPGGFTADYIDEVAGRYRPTPGQRAQVLIPPGENTFKLNDGTEMTLRWEHSGSDGRNFLVIDPTGRTYVRAQVIGDTLHIGYGTNRGYPRTNATEIVYSEAARLAKQAFPELRTVSGWLAGEASPINAMHIGPYRLGYENSHITPNTGSRRTFNVVTDINSVINRRWSEARRNEAKALNLPDNLRAGEVHSTGELHDHQLGRIGETSPLPKPIPDLPPEVNTPQGPAPPPPGPLHGPELAPQRPQPNPLEGLPDAYGLAPVEVAKRTAAPKETLHDHEAEMAQTKQQRQGDRVTLTNGPVRETADIAPEHHAQADAIIEARNIVTVTERRAMEAEQAVKRIEDENRQRQVDGKEPLPVPAEVTLALKNRNAPGMDDLRQLAASEPTHPDAQRALQVAQEQQQALAAEYAASTPDGEGDITHASRIALKEKGETPTFGERVREFFGGASTQPEATGVPGTGKRPKQKNEYSKERKYETVDGPTGPVVIYREAESDGSHKIVGRSGTIQESDILGRRESTKDEITHATSQVEVEIPGDIDPDTGEQGPSRIEVEIDPSVAINFSRNAVAGAAKARESARDAIRGRAVIDDLKANPELFQQGEAKPGSEWRNVEDLPITPQAKNRLAPGGKKVSVAPDVAQVLIEYFGQPTAKEASFLTGINAAARRWTERGLLTNVFAHFPNQFAHGLGALSGEGMTPQQATNALAHAYRQGQNPNSEYINRAKAAGVKQMSEGRQFGQNENMTAHEAATAMLEKALGHEAGTMGEAEGGSIKRAFKALNQKSVWQVDDAIRNTLFYQRIAKGDTPAQAAKYANENYVGYHTDTNLFELSRTASPRRGDQIVKKGLNEIYRHLVTGKGETGDGFAGAGASLARTLVSPLFHTFRTNSATLLAHELKGAATGLPKGDLKGLGKLANVASVGTAVGGIVGQTLSDVFLTEDQKKQGKEYQMRMGGPFHWYDTAEKMLEGRATPMQTAAAIATPNPLFKHIIGKGIFGVDVQSGRRAPAASLAELGDTVLSSVLPTGDILRNAVQGQGNAKDVAASFLMGKNAPNPAFQMMMAHPDKLAAGTPDYEVSKANFRLISQLRDLEPGTKQFDSVIEEAVKEQILTKRQIENAAKRSGQTELEHARALAKVSTPEWAVKAGQWYADRSPEIAMALYAEAQKKLGAETKKFVGARKLKVAGQIQQIENLKLLLRNQ
jgi:hypothetical protein